MMARTHIGRKSDRKPAQAQCRACQQLEITAAVTPQRWLQADCLNP